MTREHRMFLPLARLALVGLVLVALGCAAPRAAAPAAISASPVDREWEQVVAAAKREGRVVIIGPAGADVQESLTQPFMARYPEIEVEYIGPPPPQIPPKLLNERAAGQYTTDLVIVGTTTILGTLKPANALDPIRPYLIGPDIRDESAWRGGKFNFADEDGVYNLVAASRVQIPFIYNPTLISANEFKSHRDLLDPKWKGKFAMLDPRAPGASLDLMTFAYTSPVLGRPFMEQLLAQEPVISRDDRQMLDWVARGQHPFAIGASGVLAWELKGRGLPLEIFPGEALQEGAFVTASNATITAVNNAPHPNAIKVYLNFVLSQEGQREWSKAAGLASRRRDVPTDHIPSFIAPKDGVQYQENHLERYVNLKDEIAELLGTFIKN